MIDKLNKKHKLCRCHETSFNLILLLLDLPFAIKSAALVEDSMGGILLVGGLNGSIPLNTIFRLAHAGPGANFTKHYIRQLTDSD